MTRLVDYGFESVNECFDALPLRKRLRVIALRFDEWVRGNGSATCSSCKRVIREIGAPCPDCCEKGTT